MVTSSSNATLDKIIQINDILIKHLTICKDCHLRKILLQAFSDAEQISAVELSTEEQPQQKTNAPRRME